MNATYIILKTFLYLCLFRYKPQDLPHSLFLLTVTLTFYMILSGVLAPDPLVFPRNIVWSMAETGLVVILISSLLYVIKRPHRAPQTLTAILGTNALLSLLSLPLILWLGYVESSEMSKDIPTLLLIMLMFWNIAVHVYILHHALEVSVFTGLVLTIILLALMGTVLLSMFPSVQL
jgi:hypothetical protein